MFPNYKAMGCGCLAIIKQRKYYPQANKLKHNSATNLSFSPLDLISNQKSSPTFLLQTNEHPGDMWRTKIGHSHCDIYLISVSLLLWKTITAQPVEARLQK